MDISFWAWGHKDVKATHRSTLEITKDDYLTPMGDCIVAIRSEVACRDLPNEVKDCLRNGRARVTIIFEGGGYIDKVVGWGDPRLTLSSNESIVVRRSNYIDERTLAVRADKSAAELDRGLVKYLQDMGKVRITIIIEDSPSLSLDL